MDDVSPRTPAAVPGVAERILAVANRDPLTAPNKVRNDAILAVVACVVSVAIGLYGDPSNRPDAVGWVLLMASSLVVAGRRIRPVLALLAFIALITPYHALDHALWAPLVQTFLVLYTVAATGRPLRMIFVAAVVLTITITIVMVNDSQNGIELLQISGWILVMLFLGTNVRIYRQYVDSIVQRAERAERTREEEARRRVAEERLRIARDLHDLLAHSITLIGVRTSVAAHVLQTDPGRLDRAAVGAALEDIAETCRTARGELRTTLEVLRGSDAGAEPGGGRGPVPGLDGVPDLVRAARTAGAKVDLSIETPEVPPAVGAAAYRIVQEALTNAVRHAGPNPAVCVGLRAEDAALHVEITDDGRGGEIPAHGPGFGLTGMRERARSVGGALTVGPRREGGFAVRAQLPLPAEAL
ncbi:sensor histidine kinase [Streptomyces sp. NA04227]|uniref:sensor histidine kinase n=1 Tax=Streptomyces sp. NA04227 TaxID=2742136 RepID=UPI0020CA7BEB|nr:histidine kinase [Streptomyces sp. NA04227]